ncbi:rCG63272 [Rattus norvegicus]|uniref:RCG63272 n=1 Tax=Rattus norvegicus TaxID=10116 RepID=A6K768_RAT|nr:rCG63272 [Rattus norvegicus]
MADAFMNMCSPIVEEFVRGLWYSINIYFEKWLVSANISLLEILAPTPLVSVEMSVGPNRV